MTDVYVVVILDDRFTTSKVDKISAYTNINKAQAEVEKARKKTGQRSYLQRVWIE